MPGHRPKSLAFAMYLCFLIAGVVLAFLPTVFREEATKSLLLVWHAFLVIGGTVSCYGVLRGRYGIEASGLPLIIAAVLAYAVLLFYGGLTDTSTARLGVSFLFFGSSLGLAGRTVELWKLIQVAADLDKREKADG